MNRKILVNKEILIIKNDSGEGPGIIEDIIKEHSINYSVVDLDRGQTLKSPENYGAIIILGGPDSANDVTPKMNNELQFIREVMDAKIACLGICLGLQTLVKAAGGLVVKCHTKEVGSRDQTCDYYRVDLTDDGKNDPLLSGVGSSFNVFHLHGETVIPTEHMIVLGTGDSCRNQIVKVGSNCYGIQCHFELTDEMFEDWINDDYDLQKLDRELLHSDFKTLKGEYSRVCRHIINNFLNMAGYI
jgi:GMP synthase (glutamine-hydrolysing)